MTAGATPAMQDVDGAAMAIPLRPRSVSELVDASFLLLKRNYPMHVLIVALIEVPWFVISTTYTRSIGLDPNQPDFSQIPMTWLMFQLVGGTAILALLESVIARAVSDSYFGRDLDVRSVYARCFARLPAIAFLALVRNIMLFVGMVLLFVPGLWLATRYFVAMPVLILEGTSPLRALGRSGSLSDGHKWRVFKALVLMAVLYAVVVVGSLMIGSIAMLKSVPIFAEVFSLLALVLAFPLFGTIQTLFYYDLRIRKEGYDIEVMSRSLGAAPPVGQTA